MSTEAVTSFDTHLDALRHVDRRRLLLALLNAEEAALPVELDQLEYETADRDVLVSFNHNHLPKLEDRGFVDANLDRYSVTRGPRFEEIEPLLELLDTHRDRLPPGWV
ncbi:hypothetical protein BRC60_06940 [Halobacteriales archaeon QH_1_68_42]|nr:MAG: hypothetical protein BRC60_06940 [Halobacteriales archaeon QH_1_68_42]